MNPALEERREIVPRTGAMSPVASAEPVEPVGPMAPVGPVGPVGPVAPVAPVGPGPWADRFLSPPPDVAIAITPESGRSRAAVAIGDHIREQLNAGRSLYCIVHDRAVQSRLGGFDGRALPAHCLRDGE